MREGPWGEPGGRGISGAFMQPTHCGVHQCAVHQHTLHIACVPSEQPTHICCCTSGVSGTSNSDFNATVHQHACSHKHIDAGKHTGTL